MMPAFPRARSYLLPILFLMGIALVGMVGTAAAVQGYLAGLRLQAAILEQEQDQNAANRLRVSLLEAESALRGLTIHQQPEYIERFYQALQYIEGAEARRIIQRMDAIPTAPAAALIERAVATHRSVVGTLLEGQRDLAIAPGAAADANRDMDSIRETLSQFISLRRNSIAAMTSQLRRQQARVLALVAGCAGISALGVLLAVVTLRVRMRATAAVQSELAGRSAEMGALLQMNELLQACETRADIECVAGHAAQALVPGMPATLYIFSSSRDRLDRGQNWPGEGPEHITPTSCWALKRGRPNLCGQGVTCDSGGCAGTALCVPMAARGEVYGLLRFNSDDIAALDRLREHRSADAMADGMSMALANLQLRDKLRGEALRDVLTGLHNRRFLDEVGPTILRQGERRQSPTCIAVLDADHFKRVNDTFGHATGDALLRAIAGCMTGIMRGTDICVRYGGEEFVILMPDCDLGGAFERLETLRESIATMHAEGGASPAITVSIGVAIVSQGSQTLDDAMRQADEALFAAKQDGRNRVVTAAMLARINALAAPEARDHPGE
ncbi:MAG: diguanylate cyclase [Alphaproteobacteria bacterium]|nr:diguanylate cyclase [Alphaproteobacteria bacterium]